MSRLSAYAACPGKDAASQFGFAASRIGLVAEIHRSAANVDYFAANWRRLAAKIPRRHLRGLGRSVFLDAGRTRTERNAASRTGFAAKESGDAANLLGPFELISASNP
ncbi:MAG TPA: hypothetical protein VJ725_16970 [Thermoanaerobaculia bacterium]|nr:hypothetical protein [Thermoanaerobaculia bacterium]